MPFKKGRKSTRISLTNTRKPASPIVHDASDEEMAEGGGDIVYDDARDATPQEDVAEEEDEDDEEAATPAPEEDDDDDDDDDDAPPTVTTIPRRRGRGGRPRSRIGYGNTPDAGGDDGSESGTPMRRRRGRPPGSGGGRGSTRGRGRGRGGRGGAHSDAPRFIIDKNGRALDVVDDEALVDDDPEGNEKVDKKGHLQGGREYRVRTFTIMGKDERLYMLSTEPARCCGFRDSYLFFTKHPKLYKVVVGDEEKKDLIDRDILPNSYKGRNIGVVTARSVFREFGAKIIVGGRRIIDDYRVADARANGDVEGELADPDDHVPDAQEAYNRNRYVAWFGASEVYRAQAGGGTMPHTKQSGVLKRRNNCTLQNWQFMHAREASRFNTTLATLRQANLDGVYDPNTNMMFYPKIMQPTHAKWEQIPAEPAASESTTSLTNGHTTGHSHSSMEVVDNPPKSSSSSTLFPAVPSVITRNFTVVDTAFSSAPLSNAGYPGPDGHVFDPSSGPNGLSTVSQDLIEELPEECRKAFIEAREVELGWKHSWGTEAKSCQRLGLKVGLNGYPV